MVLCNPFEDSADVHVLRGMAMSANDKSVAFHCVGCPACTGSLTTLRRTSASRGNADSISSAADGWPAAVSIRVAAVPTGRTRIVSRDCRRGWASRRGSQHAAAASRCSTQGCCAWLFPGGAAGLVFERRRCELEDRLGAKVEKLYREDGIFHVSEFVNLMASGAPACGRVPQEAPGIFISYARGRHS
jgi:hypothetical protein